MIDHTNFSNWWRKVGRPPLEMLVGNTWVLCAEPVAFYANSRYRLVNDPNWALRTKWAASNFELGIERFDGRFWCAAETMCIDFKYIYREMING